MRQGEGGRNEPRSNALWGRGGRRALAMLAAMSCALVVVAGAGGATVPSPPAPPLQTALVRAMSSHLRAYIPGSLLSAVQQNPRQTFDVIIEGAPRDTSAGFFAKALKDSSANGYAVAAGQVRRQFMAIDGGQASISGWQILALGMSKNVTSIVPNGSVKTTAVDLPMSNTEKWGWSIGAPVDWTGQALSLQTPTIAIVDSGIDTSRTADFGNRVIGQTSLASVMPNSPGDGYGHGTFVAGIAAGAAAGHAGVAPNANLLSVDVMGDSGEATVADVVAACDWILANKDQYDIKVANFSLHATNPASIFFDPLDQAVEKLWLNGVTVVTAAGNYAVNGAQSDVPFAPANDPFVITVGAADIHDTLSAADDTAAPWSAWGYTVDGFSKPDLSAPGRYMIGPVPDGATLALERPDHVVAPGYMQLSGTSFSAPAVSGAAALILAEHPSWTPDQVKGALMVSARGTPAATPGSLGVGELNVPLARMVQSPPNPNAALDQYVTTDPKTGLPVFDTSSWQQAALANAAWGSAAWGSAAWGSAAWGSAAWGSAAWGSAAWGSAAWGSAAWGSAAWGSAAWSSAAWGSAAWGSAAWGDAAWSDAAWADTVRGDSAGDPGVTNSPITPDEISQTEADLGIVSPWCDPTQGLCTLLP